ncbi:MAG: hypothetical protein WC376_05035 [Candidatus Nanoarchaeia archaeon]|jgi:exosortase/archaeosortase family protein
MHKKIKADYLNEKCLKIFLYILRFLLLSVPVILIVRMDLYFIQKIYAVINNALLNCLGIKTVFFDSFSSSGLSPSLYFNQKIIRIDSACTGIRSFYLLFAMIFASNALLFKKFKYLMLGAYAIIIVNILRVLLSSVLFFNDIMGFDSIIWSTSLNLTAFAVFYFFIKNASKNV